MKARFSITHLVLMIALSFAMSSCAQQKTHSKVLEAYDLRMNANADSAKILLEEILKENPQNTLATIEFVKTKLHTVKMDPESIQKNGEECILLLNKAIEDHPDDPKFYIMKGKLEALAFYISLMMGQDPDLESLLACEASFNKAFELDNENTEGIVNLVEFFQSLPEEAGGNSSKAESYTSMLEETNFMAGARAREIMMPEDADYISYWKEIVEDNPNSAEAHQSLGRVHLFTQNFSDAEKCYLKAMELDQNKYHLYLDLGRYHIYSAMQGASLDSVKPMIEYQFNKFLEVQPSPNNSEQAWVYNKLAMLNYRTNNQEYGEQLMNKAKELDPYHSPAMGKPDLGLYLPPDEILHEQGYYLSPF